MGFNGNFYDFELKLINILVTSNQLKHHLSNIERTRTCSFNGDRTRTLYFWIRMNKHRTSNLIGLQYIYLIFHQTDSNVIFRTSNKLEHVHLLVIELEHPILGFGRSNVEF